MQEIIRALILGFVQGATEFIPVSSSGHLVIVPWLLGWGPSTLLFDTVLHWGTLVSILFVFWRDFLRIIIATFKSIPQRSLSDPDARMGWYIAVGTIPAALLGFFFKDALESLFMSETRGPLVAGVFLLVTAALLAGSELMTRRGTAQRLIYQMKWGDVAFIGFAQAFALFPGISRSGSTIAAGLVRRFRRDEAALFSFFLGAPAFFGAGLLQLGDALATDRSEVVAAAPELVIGFWAAAITGILAIRFLLDYLRNHSLYLFAGYCFLVGTGVIVLNLIR
ncbi:MAG: undecaprenyl-diphosphatase UppP [Caldilineaceae bacterium]|nr:undecaprenyl-diphosphatase UppP [Caldilineaceae bacterium]